MKQNKTWKGSSVTRRNSALFLFIFLGTLTAFGPFVTDMYLPSLPSMTGYFSASASAVQLGLTFSMLGLAAGQLLFGPLSDKYGRRAPLLASMWLFLLSTMGCIFAPNIEIFVLMRLAQGIAAAGGIVISRSIATDKFKSKNLAKSLAIIASINGIAPIAAPVTGGIVLAVTGWKGIFVVLFVLGAILLGACLHFKESLSRMKHSQEKLTKTFRLFQPLFSNRKYLCYVLQQALALGILFGYIASSPFIIQQHYGYSPLAFSLFFAVNAVSLGIGAASSVRFHLQETCVRVSCAGMTLFSLLTGALLVSGASVWIFEMGMICLCLSMGLTLTSATTLAMDCARKQAGAASALLGAAGFLAGSIVSPLVGLGNILFSTTIVFVVCALGSSFCAWLAQRRDEAQSSCAAQQI